MTHSNATQIPGRIRRVVTGLVGAAVLATLASCGGSDNGTPPVSSPAVSNTPPASASTDVNGFIAFLKMLVVTAPVTALPLDVTTFIAPTTETGLPDPSI